MNKKWLMVIMLVSMFTTAQSFAQDTNKRQKGEGGEKMFAALDTDSDGKLSVAEVDKAQKGKLKENFAEIDANKDKFIDKDELKAYREKRKAEKKEKQD